MRSFLLTLILIPLLLIVGCKRRQAASTAAQDHPSSIFAADPNVAGHFAAGFYSPEQNAWRWTKKEFAVVLSPPLNANQKGAQLIMKLAVPDAVIQKLNSVQLSASIQGLKLDPENYAKAGSYTFTRDVPADKLQGDNVHIQFTLDHVLEPTGADLRQLGIVVSEVGLVGK